MTLVTLVTLATSALALGACGPSDECRAYVACQRAYDDTVDTLQYEDDGACWNNLQSAQLCTAQCKEALAALSQLPAPPPECVAE